MKKQIKNALPALQNQSLVAARGVNDETSLSQYIQNIQKFPILSAEQEYEYAKQWTENHDAVAAEKLVASHLRMEFDPDKGFRFSTYAMFWIRAEIYETILQNWSIVKIGTSANQKRVFFGLNRARRALGIMDGNLSDDQTKQIADYLNVPENDVRRMSTRMSARDVSLNAPAHSDDDARDVLSNMPDDRTGIEENMEQVEFRRRGYELLRKHLAELPERDREILTARRLSDPVATLESLSQKYGISRERVRQIEERAYNKLRNAILTETQDA